MTLRETMKPRERISNATDRPRRPWDVFKSQSGPHPSNPLRYAHTLWFAVSVAAAAVLVTVLVFPARSVETEMRVSVDEARQIGFPDLPPGYASPEQILVFMSEWGLVGADSPTFQDAQALSQRVGEYQDESALYNLGITAGLFALVFLSAFAFTRALNNLYALGYETSVLSPAWGFASWFLPILSFVLPWRIVAETFNQAWSSPGQDDRQQNARLPVVVSALWGLSFIGLWLLNPFTVNVFVPTNDIDGWLNSVVWSERMLMWLPVPALLTAAVLGALSVKQHRRYVRLDARARAGA